jgi:hypothetical protein
MMDPSGARGYRCRLKINGGFGDAVSPAGVRQSD